MRMNRISIAACCLLLTAAAAPTRLNVTPTTNMDFNTAASYSYTLRASRGSITYTISNVPAWISASSLRGKTPATVTFRVGNAPTVPGTYSAVIGFTSNLTSHLGDTTRTAVLVIPEPPPPPPPPPPPTSNYLLDDQGGYLCADGLDETGHCLDRLIANGQSSSH